ncbi:Conserved_hypothetical protein [Hexamita inflata]|uniref:Uncharacterized protein n=1 Tax=Hexamita inflata TaxID=28002 RepID=A0ABP1HBT5_9EUKA
MKNQQLENLIIADTIFALKQLDYSQFNKTDIQIKNEFKQKVRLVDEKANPQTFILEQQKLYEEVTKFCGQLTDNKLFMLILKLIKQLKPVNDLQLNISINKQTTNQKLYDITSYTEIVQQVSSLKQMIKNLKQEIQSDKLTIVDEKSVCKSIKFLFDKSRDKQSEVQISQQDDHEIQIDQLKLQIVQQSQQLEETINQNQLFVEQLQQQHNERLQKLQSQLQQSSQQISTNNADKQAQTIQQLQQDIIKLRLQNQDLQDDNNTQKQNYSNELKQQQHKCQENIQELRMSNAEQQFKYEQQIKLLQQEVNQLKENEFGSSFNRDFSPNNLIQSQSNQQIQQEQLIQQLQTEIKQLKLLNTQLEQKQDVSVIYSEPDQPDLKSELIQSQIEIAKVNSELNGLKQQILDLNNKLYLEQTKHQIQLNQMNVQSEKFVHLIQDALKQQISCQNCEYTIQELKNAQNQVVQLQLSKNKLYEALIKSQNLIQTQKREFETTKRTLQRSLTSIEQLQKETTELNTESNKLSTFTSNVLMKFSSLAQITQSQFEIKEQKYSFQEREQIMTSQTETYNENLTQQLIEMQVKLQKQLQTNFTLLKTDLSQQTIIQNKNILQNFDNINSKLAKIDKQTDQKGQNAVVSDLNNQLLIAQAEAEDLKNKNQQLLNIIRENK